MLRAVRGRLPAALCAGAMAIAVASGCGGDDESTAKEEPVEVSAAVEPAKGFIVRMTKLIETTTRKKDCALLDQINSRSISRFKCPASKKLRKSMGRFQVVGAEEYGTGAIVDYKSGAVKDGAAIVLFVAPDRGWGISQFGVLTKPSTDTSDEESRDGYAKAVKEFLTAVRERDCETYVAVTFNGSAKKDAVCKETFPITQQLAARLKANPDAKLRYEGGNAFYGFYSLETTKPKPANLTISIAKAGADGPRPYVVLDVTPGPTAAQQKAARERFKKSRSEGASQPETSPSRKVEDDPNDVTN